MASISEEAAKLFVANIAAQNGYLSPQERAQTIPSVLQKYTSMREIVSKGTKT